MVITDLMRGGIEYFKGDSGFQLGLCLRERFKLVIGGHHGFIAIDLALLAFLICPDLWKEAGPMKIEIGIEVLLIKGIDQWGPALRNVAIAKQFPHHGPVFTFGEGKQRKVCEPP